MNELERRSLILHLFKPSFSLVAGGSPGRDFSLGFALEFGLRGCPFLFAHEWFADHDWGLKKGCALEDDLGCKGRLVTAFLSDALDCRGEVAGNFEFRLDLVASALAEFVAVGSDLLSYIFGFLFAEFESFVLVHFVFKCEVVEILDLPVGLRLRGAGEDLDAASAVLGVLTRG